MREKVARSQERSAFQEELRAHVWICQGWPRDAGARDLDQSSLVSGRGETLNHVVEERPGKRKWGESV